MLVRDAVVDHIEWKHEQGNERYRERVREEGVPKLHPSSLWFCRRKAIYGAVKMFPDHPLHVEVSFPFDFYIKELMNSGNVWENENAKAIKRAGGEHHHNFSTEHWGGQVDFLMEEDGLPVIVEHKDTATWNFFGKNAKARGGGWRIPYTHHLAQLACYRILWNRMYDEWPEAHLYYHGRDHWAEFRVWDTFDVINYEGEVDGDYRSGFGDFDVQTEMETLEMYWERQEVPPKPEGAPFSRNFGDCVRGSQKKGYYVGCPWFRHCWPDWPLDGRRLET